MSFPPSAARNLAWRSRRDRPGSRRQMLGRRRFGSRHSWRSGTRVACARLGRPGGADRRPASGRCGLRLALPMLIQIARSTATCPGTRPSPERIVARLARDRRRPGPIGVRGRGRHRTGVEGAALRDRVRPSGPDRVRRRRCGVSRGNVAMMLAGPTLRTVPVTTHVPLAEVTEHLPSALIEARGRTTLRGLQRNFGIADPRSPCPASIPTPAKAGCSAARRSS